MNFFCQTLNYYSEENFRVIKMFNTCLPHQKTPAKWYGHFNAEPGFTEESFKALKAKSTSK